MSIDIEKAIKEFEICGRYVDAKKMNKVFLCLGGKPIAKNKRFPGDKAGSNMQWCMTYINLLLARKEK